MTTKNTFFTGAIIVVVLVIAGIAWLVMPKNNPPVQVDNSVQYTNEQYGFKVALPQDWKGYSVVTGTWDGGTVQGPMISLRHPLWTEAKPYQDIPVMVFTLAQWDDLQQNKFHIGAAPVNPTELNFNANYVFALPARYNYAFSEGWEEVDQLLKTNPVQPLTPTTFNSLPANSQILLCGGIPNNSVQNITETTRIFINLPKDIYTDKDHNLQFKTVKGNATAGWISNGGTYGEAFAATPDCWSYYYEFDGKGEVDVTAKSTVANQPDYAVKVIVGSNPDSTTQQGNQVTRKVGDKEFNFLIQKINATSVDGLWYIMYPVAMMQGQPKTLYVGDTVGYACEGKTATITGINAAQQTVTFKETITTPPMGGCPI